MRNRLCPKTLARAQDRANRSLARSPKQAMPQCIGDAGRRGQRAMQPVDARQGFWTKPNATQRCGLVCMLCLFGGTVAIAAGPNVAATVGADVQAPPAVAPPVIAPPVIAPSVIAPPAVATIRQEQVDQSVGRPLFPSLTNSGDGSSTSALPTGERSWLLSTCVALAAVIALIFVARTVLVRLSGRSAAPTDSPCLEVLTRLSVAPRSNVLIIRLGRRVIAVGDSAAGLQPLADIDDPDEVAELLRAASTVGPRSASTAFRTLLQRFHGDYGQSDRLSEEGGDSDEYRVDRARDQVNGLVSRIRRLGGGGGG